MMLADEFAKGYINQEINQQLFREYEYEVTEEAENRIYLIKKGVLIGTHMTYIELAMWCDGFRAGLKAAKEAK